jgi:hypothetical protein
VTAARAALSGPLGYLPGLRFPMTTARGHPGDPTVTSAPGKHSGLSCCVMSYRVA